jgi:hypothetical protein
VPNEVAADTPVTLTVRDTGSSTPATASLTVKPRTVSNVVTVTPSASQSAVCGTAICSGGDAEVKVVLAQGGVALVGREVRFDVVSGDIRIITSAAGAPEVDSLSGTTSTDNTGTASMRVRVLADATSQTALLQVTDLSSGFTQRVAVTIAPSSNAPLNALPQTIQFTGRDASTCSSGVTADVIVFGGRPPYQVSQPSGFLVAPTIVTTNGGHVSVTSTGACARTATSISPDGGQTLAIIDGNGANVSVLIHNDPAPAGVANGAFTIGPSAVTLDSCTALANIALVGGTGSYFAASGSNLLSASVVSVSGGKIGRIQRMKNTGPTTLPTITVTFSDGQTTKDVTVTLDPGARAMCT